MGSVHPHVRRRSAPTLSALAHRLDAERYVCPSALSRRLDALLDRDGTVRVLSITAPGGYGKSAGLREAARRGTAQGYDVRAADAARHPTPDALLAALGPAPASAPGAGPAAECPLLLLVDELDVLGAGAHALGRALADLPAATRVVVAGRRGSRWLSDQLEPLHRRLRLPRLTTGEAAEVLSRYGVTGEGREELTRWAEGLPLALVLGAETWDTNDPGRRAAMLSAGEDVLAHLAGVALDQLDADLLEVAAVAGQVDRRLLADVLPDRSADEDCTVLASWSVVEPTGQALALHPVLARMARERLRERAPARAARLVLRVASHLRSAAVDGDHGALQRLAGLVADPDLSAGLAAGGSADHYDDRVRPDDRAAVEARLAEHPGVWPLVEPWLADPRARVVRTADGRCVAAATAVPLAEAETAPPDRRALVAPLVDLARRAGMTDRAVVTPFQLLMTAEGDDEAGVLRCRNAAALLHCGVPNPRYDLVNELGWTPGEPAVLAAYGYREVPELRRLVGGEQVSGWVADVGPDGLVGLLFAAVAAENGATARPPIAEPLLAALDDLWSDRALAGHPWAPLGHEERHAAASVRDRVRRRVGELLDAEPDLLDLVSRRYLAPGASHDSVIRQTYLGRSTYFRRLQRARALLATGEPG